MDHVPVASYLQSLRVDVEAQENRRVLRGLTGTGRNVCDPCALANHRRSETDRAATIAVADHYYLDNLLNTLPDKYRALQRQGMYGDFFAFYFCDVLLKVNGKGGQPVYIKVAGQATGRCAPK